MLRLGSLSFARVKIPFKASTLLWFKIDVHLKNFWAFNYHFLLHLTTELRLANNINVVLTLRRVVIKNVPLRLSCLRLFPSLLWIIQGSISISCRLSGPEISVLRLQLVCYFTVICIFFIFVFIVLYFFANIASSFVLVNIFKEFNSFATHTARSRYNLGVFGLRGLLRLIVSALSLILEALLHDYFSTVTSALSIRENLASTAIRGRWWAKTSLLSVNMISSLRIMPCVQRSAEDIRVTFLWSWFCKNCFVVFGVAGPKFAWSELTRVKTDKRCLKCNRICPAICSSRRTERSL